jgi:hypothetical protein
MLYDSILQQAGEMASDGIARGGPGLPSFAPSVRAGLRRLDEDPLTRFLDDQ